jgi:hypothetical protein
MAGYAGRVGVAEGIHDPLHVRALVISDAGATVCILACELVCVDAALTARIREGVARAIGLAPAHILVAATHTHSSSAGVARAPTLSGATRYLGAYDDEITEAWVTCSLDAARSAHDGRTTARALKGRASAEGVAANRNHRDGVYDPDVPWLALLRPSGEVIAWLYSIACHPTVLGADNLFYSGDLTGAISRQLEAVWQDSVAVGLCGAAANISTRFTRRASSFDEMERLAAAVSARFDLAATEGGSSSGVLAAQSVVTLSLRRLHDRTALNRRLNELQTRLDDTLVKEEQAVVEAEVLGIRLALDNTGQPETVTVEVQALRMGDVLLLGFPGEMFVEFGLAARHTLDPVTVLVAGCANDYIGYIPTDAAADGYETTMAVVASGAGDQLLHTAISLARSLLGAQMPYNDGTA